MIRTIFLSLSIILTFVVASNAHAQATDEMLREGAFGEIVENWTNEQSSDANAVGLTYFAAYYVNADTVLRESAKRFATIRPAGNPDRLGVGLGDIRVLHDEMQALPFLDGAERQALVDRADSETARLSQHPEPEVAAYAAFHRAFYALLNNEVDRAGSLLEAAKQEHADFLASNRDWWLMATQVELIHAQITGNPDVSRSVFEGFSFDRLTGSPFEGGFLDSLAEGLLNGEDGALAREFVEALADVLSTHPDLPIRFWRTFYLARSVGDSPHEMPDLALRLYTATGEYAAGISDVTGEDVYYVTRFEMLGNLPQHRRALLMAALDEQGTIGPSDSYFGPLLTILSEDEATWGNTQAAQLLARRAAEQHPSA